MATGAPYDEIEALVVGFDQWSIPEPSRTFSVLGEELRLAKAGALYADSVTFASQTAILAIVTLQQGIEELPADAFAGKKEIPVSDLITGLGPAETRAAEDLASGLAAGVLGNPNPFIAGYTLASWMEGDLPTGNLPLVSARTLEATSPEAFALAQVEFAQSAEGQERIELMEGMLDDPEAGPLRETLIESIARMKKLRAGDLSAERIGPAPRPRSPEVELLTGVLGGIRAFPDADWDTILDVRERLGPARTQLRAAISEAAAELEGCGDEEVERASAALRKRVVAPALAEIDAELDELGAIPTLLRMAQGAPMAGSVLANLALVADPATLGLSAIAHGIASAPILASGARELAQRRERRRNLAARPYWILHELQQGGS